MLAQGRVRPGFMIVDDAGIEQGDEDDSILHLASQHVAHVKSRNKKGHDTAMSPAKDRAHLMEQDEYMDRILDAKRRRRSNAAPPSDEEPTSSKYTERLEAALVLQSSQVKSISLPNRTERARKVRMSDGQDTLQQRAAVEAAGPTATRVAAVLGRSPIQERPSAIMQRPLKHGAARAPPSSRKTGSLPPIASPRRANARVEAAAPLQPTPEDGEPTCVAPVAAAEFTYTTRRMSFIAPPPGRRLRVQPSANNLTSRKDLRSALHAFEGGSGTRSNPSHLVAEPPANSPLLPLTGGHSQRAPHSRTAIPTAR